MLSPELGSESESMMCHESYYTEDKVPTDLMKVRDLCRARSPCDELELDFIVDIVLHKFYIIPNLSTSISGIKSFSPIRKTFGLSWVPSFNTVACISHKLAVRWNLLIIV